MAVFQRLLRFEDPAGQIFFGELRDKVPRSQQELVGLETEVFELGLLPWQKGFKLSGVRAKIAKVRENPVFCDLLSKDEHTIELNHVESLFQPYSLLTCSNPRFSALCLRCRSFSA